MAWLDIVTQNGGWSAAYAELEKAPAGAAFKRLYLCDIRTCCLLLLHFL
jgi:hypothetical protein